MFSVGYFEEVSRFYRDLRHSLSSDWNDESTWHGVAIDITLGIGTIIVHR